jgi:hypothetical protein
MLGIRIAVWLETGRQLTPFGRTAYSFRRTTAYSSLVCRQFTPLWSDDSLLLFGQTTVNSSLVRLQFTPSYVVRVV